MRCTHGFPTENRRRRYRFWGYGAEIFSECALTYSPKIEGKKIQQMLFFGRYGRKCRQQWIFEVAQNPLFFTFSAIYRPFLDEKNTFFSGVLLDVFCPYPAVRSEHRPHPHPHRTDRTRTDRTRKVRTDFENFQLTKSDHYFVVPKSDHFFNKCFDNIYEIRFDSIIEYW